MEQRRHALPESLAYLPGYVRAEIEPAQVVEHHFVRWLLQIFESNLHLAERLIQNSHLLFSPDEAGELASRVGAPTLYGSELVDVHSLASRLLNPSDPLSAYVWDRFSSPARETLLNQSSLAAGVEVIEAALVGELNKIIWGESIYHQDRFIKIRFSPATRALLDQTLEGEALARFNRRLLEDGFSGEIRALPESPVLDPVRDKSEWLRWLASWVALDFDEDWLSEKPSTAGGGSEDKPGPQHFAKARRLIKNAVPLYRRRGTARGLAETIKEFYDWDVEILERSYPQGMELGSQSSIGLGTWLLDEPVPDEQFTVLITSTEANLRRLNSPGMGGAGQLVESTLAGASSGRRVEWLLGGEPELRSEAVPVGADLSASIHKLRELLDREKPNSYALLSRF